jgi:phosphoribosylaminoimidazolecarboxamide formyltransferase/IMP cyclohydrolase
LTKLFLEVVIAPEFSKEALGVLASKKNLRCLAWAEMNAYQREIEIRSISGGVLVQDGLCYSSAQSSWEFLGARPTPDVIQDLEFGEKVVSSLKSNAIALVLRGQTLGLGMGQTNRVDAVKLAVERARSFHSPLLAAEQSGSNQKNSSLVLVSDAFFPFPDSMVLAAEIGVKWVLQPGGSIRDHEVVEAARKIGIEMVLTKQRKFKH